MTRFLISILTAVLLSAVHHLPMLAGDETAAPIADCAITPKNEQAANNSDTENSLAPTKPILKNIHFERQIWDYEDDVMWKDSWLSFDIECEGEGLKFFIEVSKDYKYDWIPDLNEWDPHVFMDLYVSETDGHSGYDADWDEFFSIYVYNKYGNSRSDVYLTNDYITDPTILEHIESYHNGNPNTGITLNRCEDYGLRIHDDVVEIHQSYLKLIVSDVAGNSDEFYCSNLDHLYLTNLASGIYLITAISNDNQVQTIKYLKK